MEFNGAITKVLPKRSGTSERTGNRWERLPFIFEYKENPTDRSSDAVILESFSTEAIKSIEKWMETDADGKPIIQNGVINLTRPLYVRIGFGHKVHSYTPQNGGETKHFNDLSIYNFEWLKQPETPPTFQQQPAQIQAAAPQPQPQGNGEQADDLPF